MWRRGNQEDWTGLKAAATDKVNHREKPWLLQRHLSGCIVAELKSKDVIKVEPAALPEPRSLKGQFTQRLECHHFYWPWWHNYKMKIEFCRSIDIKS